MTREQGSTSRSGKTVLGFALLAGVLVSVPVASAQYPATYPSEPQIHKDGTAVLIEDYASLPLSNPTHGGASTATIDFRYPLGRPTSLRAEPANAPLAKSRFFIDDQNGTIYIFDKAGKKFTPYLKFADIFPKFVSDQGNTSGIVSIAFDPGYAKNGKFYTVHVEKSDVDAPATPTNARTPGLNLNGYTTTTTVSPHPAGSVFLEGVLVEWTDTNIRNSTFEGTARELLRVAGYSPPPGTTFDRNHPLGDLIFNPLARPGQDDYGNLYVSVGDGAQGETPGPLHTLPQQLNALLGKVLRITPDITLHPGDMLGSNGRYRIPSSGSNANPFVHVAGARPEIYAYGLRNPHRMTWDIDSKALIVNSVGLHLWEEVIILVKGANYGYAEREGNEQLFVDNSGKTGSLMNPPVAFPERDLLQVTGLDEPVTPLYPAAVYSHLDGTAIGSGVVYRGKLMPQLRGKYIFNDLSTGRIFYTDLAEMLASHGQRNHQAQIHEIQLMYKSPNDTSNQVPVKRRMYDIVAEGYAHKGGTPPENHVMPISSGSPTHPDPEGIPYGGGRADVRVAVDGDGELYVLSKSDGMIRKLTAVVTPPPTAK